MKRPRTAISLAIAFSIFTATCLASERVGVWGVDIINYGSYRVKKEQIEDITETPGGRCHIITETEFIEQTFRIPAILGIRFGFRYRINGTPKGKTVPIMIKKVYPGLKDPMKPNMIYGHDYVRAHEIGHVYGTGYGFDHAWELVPGMWTFQLQYEGKILGEISFEVYKAK